MNHGQSMFSAIRSYRLPLSLLALLVIAGCGDDDSGPNTPDLSGSIRGVVVDAEGNAVADAGIVISLWPTVLEVAKSGGTTQLKAPGPTNEDMEAVWITDYCDETVRVLCDGDCPEQGSMTWDGLNDAGLQVLDGVYYANVRSGDALQVQDLLLVREYDEVWAHATHEFSTFTDVDGRFEISQDCLPLGYEFDIRDSEGNVTGTRVVSRWVHIVCVDAANRSARRDSVFVDEQLGAEIDIRYP